ncbi:hypothetical protein [Aquabacterium sp. OR-4]|uniref:hypothetical protein n=1 Tax=Aquabacterium sp. OR-4 TaxID=2978127 RepID=UPI0021B1D66E|nr:hypothetical protein [Aquabacterium sp. OR-4]MDT7838270.1 hypothetical protein [Aquabacterium sp. OR-4]
MSSGAGGPRPAWQASRQDSGPSTITPPDAVPVPAPFGPLAGDMARLFRVLGLQSFRASVVDMASMAYEAAWLVGENGELVDEPDRAPLDSAFPGSTSVVARLANASLDETIDQPLGARRCVYAWRMDGLRVVIAEARYHERHNRTRELDIAAARLVCSAGLMGRQGGGARSGEAAMPLNWSQPAPVAPGPSRGISLAGLGLSLAAAGLGAWLTVLALPALNRETQAVAGQAVRLRTMTDETLGQGLTTALASGDYGEVQNQLGSFESLGYFRGALITNARQRVVAIAGQVDDTLRIGIELPEGTLPKAQSRDLVQGAERFGRLVIVKPAGDALAPPDLAPLRTVAGVATGAAALAALLLLWALRRPGAAR